jgi:hypothetical protein
MCTITLAYTIAQKAEVTVLQAAVSSFAPSSGAMAYSSIPVSPTYTDGEVRFDTRTANEINLDAFYQASHELAALGSLNYNLSISELSILSSTHVTKCRETVSLV